MEEWAKQSAVSLTKAIRDKKISSSELLDYFIERYERLNPKINAIVATNFDDARKKAAEADKALSKGEVFGPLHGLPMTLKDNLETAGIPTTYGSPLFKENIPDENTDVVQSVLDAGAVVFGKTNLPLFAGDLHCFNDLHGRTNNPWDPSRTPGGSSGGAAAALAAGLTGLEIGNDIAGSIRIPAHFCGIYGHKPSFGIVSMHGGKKPWPWFRSKFPIEIDMAVTGPLARSADDLKLAMDVIVNAPVYQRKAIKITLPEPRKKNLSEFKVGVWMHDSLYPPDNDVGAVLSDLIDRLSITGITLINKKPEVDLKVSRELRNALEFADTSLMKSNEAWEKATNALNMEDENVRAWGKATTMQHRDWIFLNAVRSFIRQSWDDYFNEVDVMLCPVAPIAAHPHDHTPLEKREVKFNGETVNYWEIMVPWNSLALVSYLPATVSPAGFTPGGLPVGVQIVGPYLEDLTTIQFAINLEKEIIGPYQLPPGYN